MKPYENMKASERFFLGAAVVLGGLYVGFFTDWFRDRPIRIEHTTRPLRDAWRGDGTRLDPSRRPGLDVSFSLHGNYRLTSVKVVPLADYRTNRFAHPLWHVVSEDGSDPVNSIAYGRTLPGMEPSVAGAEADPLRPDVEYRLLVETRNGEGEHDFMLEPPPIRP